MKIGSTALALLATLSVSACAKQNEAGNNTSTEVTANTDAPLIDANSAADNGADLGAADLNAAGENVANSL